MIVLIPLRLAGSMRNYIETYPGVKEAERTPTGGRIDSHEKMKLSIRAHDC